MVATRQANNEEEILAIARLIKVHGVNEAEFTIVISDQCQGQGLGAYLLKMLLEIGRQEGLERIIGHVLADNYRMQEVCKKLGFLLTSDDFADDIRAEITL
jgi:acetyltransferase